jgi:hypothetical protein
MTYRILTGKLAGRLRNDLILPPRIRTSINIRRLKQKLMKRDKPTRFIDSLSDLGNTIVSSYLNEHNITIMPTMLR